VGRPGLLNGLDHVLPVKHTVHVIYHLANVVEPRLVGQHLPDGDIFLAGLAELRPVLRHPGIVINQPAVVVNVQECRGNALGGGETGCHGITTPQSPPVIAIATPEIHHRFSPVIDANRGPPGVILQLVAQPVFHAAKIRVDIAVQVQFPWE
jgi:hypothetical protein